MKPEYTKKSLGSHCPSIIDDKGQPVLVMPPQWKGLVLEETIIPGASECGPQYSGMPILAFGLSGVVNRWYRSGLKTLYFDNRGPLFDVFDKNYERDYGRWEGIPGTAIRVSLPASVIQRYLPEQAYHFDLEPAYGQRDPKLY